MQDAGIWAVLRILGVLSVLKVGWGKRMGNNHLSDEALPMPKLNQSSPSGATLSNQIRTILADDIIEGRIPPGAEIDEQELALRFGASRTPVREALRDLSASGLVIIEPRKGARVVEMTMETIGELFEVMAEVEAICVRLATYRILAHERALLSQHHADALPMVRAGDIDGYDRINFAFPPGAVSWRTAIECVLRRAWPDSKIDFFGRWGCGGKIDAGAHAYRRHVLYR
jgi:DNA-binding transcriptional regulator YhcF (GntR family)